MAICNWALGCLLYGHANEFITKKESENYIFDRSKKHIENAISIYKELGHIHGIRNSITILNHIRKKLKVKIVPGTVQIER